MDYVYIIGSFVGWIRMKNKASYAWRDTILIYQTIQIAAFYSEMNLSKTNSTKPFDPGNQPTHRSLPLRFKIISP